MGCTCLSRGKGEGVFLSLWSHRGLPGRHILYWLNASSERKLVFSATFVGEVFRGQELYSPNITQVLKKEKEKKWEEGSRGV